MRAALLRLTAVSLVTVMAVFGLPTIIAGFMVAWSDQQTRAAHGTPGGLNPWVFLCGSLLLATFAVGVVLWRAQRRAAHLNQPLAELARQAERLGAGSPRSDRLQSGIVEIDRVSDVLADSAHRLLTSLSSERDFASDASHQLRTPLTALLMRLEEISLTDDLQAAHEEAVIAIDQVERLNATVDALLSRARARKAESRDVSLDSCIAALMSEWQPAFGAVGRAIHVTGERDLRVGAEQVSVTQILHTLIENGLKHGAGTVQIDARRSGPSVIVEVSDQGPGVPPEIAARIFDRSFSTKSTGIGLALARDLAESSGGRLELVRGYPVVFAMFLSAADAVDPFAPASTSSSSSHPLFGPA